MFMLLLLLLIGTGGAVGALLDFCDGVKGDGKSAEKEHSQFR